MDCRKCEHKKSYSLNAKKTHNKILTNDLLPPPFPPYKHPLSILIIVIRHNIFDRKIVTPVRGTLQAARENNVQHVLCKCTLTYNK